MQSENFVGVITVVRFFFVFFGFFFGYRNLPIPTKSGYRKWSIPTYFGIETGIGINRYQCSKYRYRIKNSGIGQHYWLEQKDWDIKSIETVIR